MPLFRYSDAAEKFIASADSRETSPEIMEAIAFFARDLAEAEALWNGNGFGHVCHELDMWERVTKNGLHVSTDFVWGAAGTGWWSAISDGSET